MSNSKGFVKSINSILVLVLFLPSVLFASGPSYDDIRKIIGLRSNGLVELSAKSQSELQSYFDDLNSRMVLPSDSSHEFPKVYLVETSGNDNFAAFVKPSYPGYVFWNPDFLINSPSADIDMYVMAHELRHFTDSNRSREDTRSKEYDADIMAISERLFRLGLRNSSTGKPQAGVVNPEALINYLRTQNEYQEDYINQKALSAGVKVLYAQERNRRDFPSVPQRRYGLEGVLKELKNQNSKSYSGSSNKKDKVSDTELQVQTIKGRIDGEYFDAIKALNARLEYELTRNGSHISHSLKFDFLSTLERIIDKSKYDKPLKKALFESLSSLDPDWLSKWQKHIVNEDLSTSSNLPLFHWINHKAKLLDFSNLLESKSSDEAIQDYITLFNHDILGDLKTTLFGTSRLLKYLVDNHRKIDLSDKHEFVFVLQILLRSLRKNLDLSPKFIDRFKFNLIAKFERIYGAQIKKAVASDQFNVAIIRILENKDLEDFGLFTSFLFSEDFDQIFPNLRNKLAGQLHVDDSNVLFKLSLMASSVGNFNQHMKNLMTNGQESEFLKNMTVVRHNSNSLFKKYELASLWISFFKNKRPKIETYLKNLDRAILELEFDDVEYGLVYGDKSLFWNTVDSFTEKNKKSLDPIRQYLKEIALSNPVDFFKRWRNDTLNIKESRKVSPIALLLDWDKFFAGLSYTAMREILNHSNFVLDSGEVTFQRLQIAFMKKILSMVNGFETVPQDILKLAIDSLNTMSSATPESQILVDTIIKSLLISDQANSRHDLILFLTQVKIVNFKDSDDFVSLTVDALVRYISIYVSGGLDFPLVKVPTLIHQFSYINRTADPNLKLKILTKLASRYQAPLSLKHVFSLETLNKIPGYLTKAVDETHLWVEVFRQLSDEYTVNLLYSLRGQTKLIEPLSFELQNRLAKSGILIKNTEVEGYLQTRFSELQPFQRAALFQIALDGTTNLLDTKKFRNDIFRSVLGSIPDPNTKKVFLDLWDAGMHALPKVLHSLVLSIVLSESGRTGRPERALVTLFSNMGPLEQKFGQMLAFSNIPEAYRQELRTLWDNAQELSWWEAWDLILTQHGDITKVGYSLTEILNSGSTEIFLKIKHLDSGREFVISVYRDGVNTSVNVGSKQLRLFTQYLAKKNSGKYGFLPLLVEDSIRTMRSELNSEHKRQMSYKMAKAYRDAALRLGYTVDRDGTIKTPNFNFRSSPFHTLTLENGKVVYMQELAEGSSLRKLKDEDSQKYMKVIEELLKLESNVMLDPEAPVDKDRMPGQNIFSQDLSTNFILDHGQALILSPEVHAAFAELTVKGFQGDIDWMVEKTKELTGYDDLETTDLKKVVLNSEISYRPLIFLSEISPQFLSMQNSDRRKKMFFELLHGVRAKIRLLQWEQSEGLSTLNDELRVAVLQDLSLSEKVSIAVAGFKIGVTNAVSSAWHSTLESVSRYLFRKPEYFPVRTMNRSYLRTQPVPNSCEVYLSNEF